MPLIYGATQNTPTIPAAFSDVAQIPDAYNGIAKVDDALYVDTDAGLVNVNKYLTGMPRLITIGCGNSIAVQSRVAVGSEATSIRRAGCEHVLASAMAGDVLTYKECAADTLYTDKYGWYSHSGATSAQILSEIEASQLIPVMNSGIVPDLYWIHALSENDVPDSYVGTAQATLNNYTQLIAIVKAYFPNIKFIVATCRPSFQVTLESSKERWKTLNQGIIALDNGSDIFVTQVHKAYNNPQNPHWADYITAVGSISGTVLTVESMPAGTRLYANSYVTNLFPSTGTIGQITVTPSGAAGREGIYTIVNAGGLSAPAGSTIYIHNFVDGYVHPTTMGNTRSAYVSAAVLRRIGSGFRPGLPNIIPNGSLIGSSAISGGTIAGGSTAPTNVASYVNPTVGVVTYTALNPGMRVSCTGYYNTGNPGEWFTIGLIPTAGVTLYPTLDAFQTRVKIQVRKGGHLIKNFNYQSRPFHGATLDAPTTHSLSGVGTAGDNCYDFKDGTILTFCSATQRCIGHGVDFISLFRMYLSLTMQPVARADEIVEFDILDIGVYPIQDGVTSATLVAGTVTVSDARVKATSKIRFFRRAAGGTIGAISETARVAGTSVTFTSSNAADTSIIGYTVE